jgi:serine/threonine-protein kinase
VRTCGQCSIKYPDTLEFCPRDGQRLPPPPGGTQELYDPLVGSTIDGRYVVEALLGQGGMGFVYAARHAIIDKRVAIKVLRKEAAQDEASAQRFIAEAKAASKIGHQNIVDITDFGVLQHGHAYFVMEFLDGPILSKLSGSGLYLEPKRAIGIAIQIARGLHAAHQKGIIHRDLKPENIFVLERDGQNDVVKIVDFGIAKDTRSSRKLTQVGMVLGTPEYMSPEQATGQPTDHRVDMYALGCILYEMLIGEVPFKGENSNKTLTKHVFESVTPPSQRRPDLEIPPALEAVVLRTLEKKPNDRYGDMKELMSELERVDGELRSALAVATPTPTPTPLASPPSPPPEDAHPDTEQNEVVAVPRSRSGLYLALGVAAVALAIGVMALTGGKKKPPPPLPAVATPEPPKAPEPAPPAPAPAAPEPKPERSDVEIVLRTVPPGAEIYDGQALIGASPLTFRRARGDGAVNLTFRRAGFREVTREVVPDRDRDVEVVLMARPKSAPPPRSAAAPVAPPEETPDPATRPAARPAQPRRVSDLRNPFE